MNKQQIKKAIEEVEYKISYLQGAQIKVGTEDEAYDEIEYDISEEKIKLRRLKRELKK